MINAQTYAKQAEGIFTISDSFVKIRELSQDNNAELEDIAQVVTLDPALAAAVLKLANSAFFNFPAKVDTVSKAVSLLGVTEIYNLAIAYFISGALKASEGNHAYLKQFWTDSVDCALLVRFLAKQMQIKNPERLYIMGLLHNIGELVVQQLDPATFEECASSDIEHLPWQQQKDTMGFTYADITTELLQYWKLPLSISNPTQQQNKEDIKGNYPEARLLYLAKRVMLHNNYFQDQSINQLLSKEFLSAVNITQDTIDNANEYCTQERLSMMSLLSI